MNQVIPDLGRPQDKVLWAKMEAAKRRLIDTLLSLQIHTPTKKESATDGMAFKIVSTVVDASITTGHLNGVITVNLEEADDTYRQINRQLLGESKRSLLGHFRHESAHYLWMRFLSNEDWAHPCRQAFRKVFGDEWQDYASSLRSYYQSGPAVDWESHYVSAYASSHPWEDWAETWSHYLQMLDGLETCEAMGIQAVNLALPLQMLDAAAGNLPAPLKNMPEENGYFLAMLQRWICLSTVLNEVAESLGEPSPCPFIISVPIAQKLRLAHYFATAWGAKS